MSFVLRVSRVTTNVGDVRRIRQGGQIENENHCIIINRQINNMLLHEFNTCVGRNKF